MSGLRLSQNYINKLLCVCSRRTELWRYLALKMSSDVYGTCYYFNHIVEIFYFVCHFIWAITIFVFWLLLFPIDFIYNSSLPNGSFQWTFCECKNWFFWHFSFYCHLLTEHFVFIFIFFFLCFLFYFALLSFLPKS